MFGIYFLGAVNASGLHGGEEVYLTKNGKEMFKAQSQHCLSDTIVYGEVIGKENGRFFINKCLKMQANGAAVKWSLKSLHKIKKEIIISTKYRIKISNISSMIK